MSVIKLNMTQVAIVTMIEVSFIFLQLDMSKLHIS